MSLSDLRRELATARDELREQKANHETMKAIREQAAINGGALATCKNAEDRARALLIALDQDQDYIEARDFLRNAEADVDRLGAEIAILEDERKADELRIRDAANQALDRYSAALTKANPVRMAIDAALPF